MKSCDNPIVVSSASQPTPILSPSHASTSVQAPSSTPSTTNKPIEPTVAWNTVQSVDWGPQAQVSRCPDLLSPSNVALNPLLDVHPDVQKSPLMQSSETIIVPANSACHEPRSSCTTSVYNSDKERPDGQSVQLKEQQHDSEEISRGSDRVLKPEHLGNSTCDYVYNNHCREYLIDNQLIFDKPCNLR